MTEPASWLPRAIFGPIGSEAPGLPYDGHDPDDEELAETPADVVGMLGFDPKLVAEEEAAAAFAAARALPA